MTKRDEKREQSDYLAEKIENKMNGQRKHKHTITRFMTSVIILIISLGFAGCSPGIKIGGYKHADMSRSHYRGQIRRKADDLAKSKSPQDIRLAAELYGSIKELELMDECIATYFDNKPSMGVYLLRRGKAIHKFYKSSH